VFLSYFKYFTKFILFSKNRQRLLLLAIAGLVLSSFALIVLQSTMGGLQNKLMERSKNILGRAQVLIPKDTDDLKINQLVLTLQKENLNFVKEYEVELLIRYKSYLNPAIVHGIDLNDYLPSFIKSDSFKEGMLPMELAYKMEFLPPDEIQLISPSHVDSLFVDIPRAQTVKIDKSISTEVPEVDGYHMWVRLPLVQNLIQSKTINRIRIYSKFDLKQLKNVLPVDFVLRTWEEENNSLVWALNLESTIMIFLFAAMSLLVSLCITSGLLIFFNKIKNDLSSFWILGASLQKINLSTTLFLHLMSLISILLGLFLGLGFLFLFDKLGANIMPDVFVDRKIPVLITTQGILISTLVPYVISFIFVQISLNQFKKDHNLLDHVRSIS
jgi:lipoprotein-releasing system permease protein